MDLFFKRLGFSVWRSTGDADDQLNRFWIVGHHHSHPTLGFCGLVSWNSMAASWNLLGFLRLSLCSKETNLLQTNWETSWLGGECIWCKTADLKGYSLCETGWEGCPRSPLIPSSHHPHHPHPFLVWGKAIWYTIVGEIGRGPTERWTLV